MTTTTTSRATTAPDGATMAFRQPGDANTLGVWWWNVSQVKTAKADTYLDFCQKNRFQTYVDKFGAYQKAASKEERFYAMHLDVEPHQHPDFKTGADGRAKVMQLFADFTLQKAVPAAKAAGTLLEWDIPFWMTDVVKDGSGASIVLAELMARECDTIAVMSYRDTAAAMWDVSKEEIAYAKKYGHKVILGAETYSKEGDAVSYMEEGKTVMVSELTKLNAKLLSNLPNRNFGLAVHQIDRWYSLKN